MSILDEIVRDDVWREYMSHKMERFRFSQAEARALSAYIDGKAYLSAADAMCSPDYRFDPPQKREINKFGTSKKRVVYTFDPDATCVLKLIAHLLHRYDFTFSPGCCAFRRDLGAKQVLRRLRGLCGVEHMYSYKVDIKNYFNSIDVNVLLGRLGTVLNDDERLFSFLARMLSSDEAVFEGKLINEKRGVMAGTPTSPFLANVYLMGLDAHFFDLNIPYARYSDDIIVFANSEDELRSHIAFIGEWLERDGLSINHDKERIGRPGEPWDYLGIKYRAGVIGLSRASADKLKGKIRRKARALYRWKQRSGADDMRAMAAFARAINKKLYDNPRSDELTWARWFFPLLTSTDDLQALDEYIRQNMRYVACGHYQKSNWRISHDVLRACGLKSLVGEYYSYMESLIPKSGACAGTDEGERMTESV